MQWEENVCASILLICANSDTELNLKCLSPGIRHGRLSDMNQKTPKQALVEFFLKNNTWWSEAASFKVVFKFNFGNFWDYILLLSACRVQSAFAVRSHSDLPKCFLLWFMRKLFAQTLAGSVLLIHQHRGCVRKQTLLSFRCLNRQATSSPSLKLLTSFLQMVSVFWPASDCQLCQNDWSECFALKGVYWSTEWQQFCTYHLFLLKRWTPLGRLGCVLAHLVQPGAAAGAELSRSSLLDLSAFTEGIRAQDTLLVCMGGYISVPCVPVCAMLLPCSCVVGRDRAGLLVLVSVWSPPREGSVPLQGKCLLWGIPGWPGSLWPGCAFNSSWGGLSQVQEARHSMAVGQLVAPSRGSWSPFLQACVWPWLMLETLLKMPTLWKPWQMPVFFVSTRGWSGWRRWLPTETAWGVAQPAPSMTESLPGVVRRLIIQFGPVFSLQGGIL